jgi:hypothetical protein
MITLGCYFHLSLLFFIVKGFATEVTVGFKTRIEKSSKIYALSAAAAT